MSFGKDDHFWTNVFPTRLLEKHAKEIKRFKWAIKIMRWFELFCALFYTPCTLECGCPDFANEFASCTHPDQSLPQDVPVL